MGWSRQVETVHIGVGHGLGTLVNGMDAGWYTQDFCASQNIQKSPQSSDRSSQIASLLTTCRTALALYEDWGLESKLLLLGDFNAHIGRDDNQGTKKLIVGYDLIHPTSNHLGSFLLDFCEQDNLVISSTWGCRSCKVTWRSGQRLQNLCHLPLKTPRRRKKEAISNYQAAFMRYRSTDDHIFVVRRILDEKWKAGKPAYVLQLDIEKAFDSVDFCALYDILKTRVNTTLANRIMSYLKEHTSILWFGQKTQSITKGKEVKQGCPFSSRLFTIVLDDVLRTLEELFSEVRLAQDAEINLPVILSFADDIIIIGDSVTVLINIMKNLKELLISVGLKLNETKTKMLIRDPINKSIAEQIQEINGVLITLVDTKIFGYVSDFRAKSKRHDKGKIKTSNPQCERSHSLHQEYQNALENRQVDLQNGDVSLHDIRTERSSIKQVK
ncbi:Retrovirus-related Pol polyprotein from type-2 retrotransposable element R2DM; Endonuclease [Eumeta japonica]|uniref:Retrovirus-related Pol polyprotein from type-2 retrotransposable element R2DM Endonuclease n=1 Tax=Eumeta variegata TaxID=151549 RepID=A0A4C1VYE0_EUMVA|nr:Retrovirus-related Pol polyprotein from type-2 retrotransposable element R2DM; Endonuclease [Eumeta japonica]